MHLLSLDPLTLRVGGDVIWVEFNGTKIADRFAIATMVGVGFASIRPTVLVDHRKLKL